MHLDNLLVNCQSKTRATRILTALAILLNTIEAVKDIGNVFFGNTNSCILNLKFNTFFISAPANDTDFSSVRRELNRIVDQIYQNLRQTQLICQNRV